MKKIVIAAALASCAALGGCTSQDVQNVLTGLNAACVGLTVGSQIAVIVTSSIGGSTKVTGGTVAGDVTQSCAAISASTQAVINQIVAAGGTATVTVQTTPTASKARMLARFKVWRDRDGATQAVYVVRPDHSIPLIGNLLDLYAPFG